MKRATEKLAILVIVSLLGLVSTAQSQRLIRLSEEETKDLVERIEKGADTFRSSVEDALEDSRFDGSTAEDEINRFIRDFESATDRLEDRFDDDRSASDAVRAILTRAAAIDGFMMRNRLSPRAQGDWQHLRRNLDELARAYNVSWNWTGISNEPFRVDDKRVETLLDRIESLADGFRSSLDDALERTRFDDTRAEDEINSYVKEFERATDRLEDRFDKSQSAASDAEEVLRRADRIDDFMRLHGHILSPRANSDWEQLRRSLDELALAYAVSWTW